MTIGGAGKMAKRKLRKIHIDSMEWKWYVSHRYRVVIFSPNDDRYEWQITNSCTSEYVMIQPHQIRDYIIDKILKNKNLRMRQNAINLSREEEWEEMKYYDPEIDW